MSELGQMLIDLLNAAIEAKLRRVREEDFFEERVGD